MGTGGPNPAAGAGLALIGLTKLLRGDRHISKLLDDIAFGSYNDRFGGGTPEDPNPWLTTDEEIRKRYNADPLCTFKFTVSAMGDLITLTKESNRAQWYKNLPKDVPMLLVAGADDPVGDYGKGVRYVHEHLQAAGIHATCKIYDGVRHEILNDVSYDEVVKDILDFCK
jgi:alpha-beta hydrolase superfamily lysophospholipase